MENNMISAEEAKNLACKTEIANPLVTGMFSSIKYAAENGKRDCNFFTDGHHLSDTELEMVRRLGYEVSWNRACLWYEISW